MCTLARPWSSSSSLYEKPWSGLPSLQQPIQMPFQASASEQNQGQTSELVGMVCIKQWNPQRSMILRLSSNSLTCLLKPFGAGISSLMQMLRVELEKSVFGEACVQPILTT